MKNQRFRKLDVWKKSIDFVGEIYQLTKQFPDKEIYGLTSQLRRAATSIALNIAEGSGSDSDAEFKRFLTIAMRSNYELMCGIEIAKKLNYCSEIEADGILEKLDELAAMLVGLKRKLTQQHAVADI